VATALAVALLLAGLPPSRISTAAANGPKAYVGLFKENAVAVLDTTSGAVLSKIAVPAGPHGLAATPDGRKVYVASDGENSVSAIDTATDTVASTIEVGSAPHGVAVTPDGRLLLVGVWGDNQLAVVDTATDQVARRSQIAAPHNIAIAADGTYAYVGSQAADAPELVRIDVATGETLARLPIDGAPRGLSISPDGAWLYLTRAGADDVLVVNTASDQEIARIAIGPSPHLPSFAPTGLAVVDSQGLGQLMTIDPARHGVVGSVGVGQRPHWTAISTDGTTAFQTNEASNDVSVVDLATLTLRATFPVGEAPRKIVLLPGSAAVNAPGSVTGPVSVAAPAPKPASAQASRTDDQTIADVEVRIERFRFGPPVTISAGQTVAWVNDDSAAHTVTLNGRDWSSPELQRGDRFARRFESPGEYAYFCELHSYMRGQVSVR
jgi:YVTN family beta-propeller protein